MSHYDDLFQAIEQTQQIILEKEARQSMLRQMLPQVISNGDTHTAELIELELTDLCFEIRTLDACISDYVFKAEYLISEKNSENFS